MKTLKNALALSAVVATASLSSGQPPNDSSTTGSANDTTSPASLVNAIDARATLKPADFKRTAAGIWESQWHQADFPFDELIYYWNLRPERDEGFRLYLQVRFGPGDESPWLYAGFWGKVKPFGDEEREKPKFDRGTVEHDQLLMKQKASAWRFRVVSEGPRPLSKRPLVGVITTDNAPSPEMTAIWRSQHRSPAPARILDVPVRWQQDTGGNSFPDRCQSAAVAAAMQYFGTTVPLEQIVALTTDFEYRTFGIWPRTINAAHEFGFEAYLDRFRDWERVKDALAENKVILSSITMPRNDTYVAPPYPSTGGHIVALCGITDDGRVIVTDSARRGGYLSQWVREDFEKIWMRNKGGVGMVIVPPKGAPERLVGDVPPFPDRTPPGTTADAPETTATDEPTSPTEEQG
jgi:hypothetical protein